MVAFNAGVVKSGLEIREVPPVRLENQSSVPAPVACSVTVPPAQIVVPEAIGAAGGGVTAATTGMAALEQPVGPVKIT